MSKDSTVDYSTPLCTFFAVTLDIFYVMIQKIQFCDVIPLNYVWKISLHIYNTKEL